MSSSRERLTIGRIVHYVARGSADGVFAPKCRAAIVSEVADHLPSSMEPLDGCPNGTDGVWVASLTVLNPTGMHWHEDAKRDSDKVGGTWHWPAECDLDVDEVETDRGFTLNQMDLRVEVMRNAAPLVSGSQAKPAKVKVTHLPTGLSAEAAGRSALEAKADALRILTDAVETAGAWHE